MNRTIILLPFYIATMLLLVAAGAANAPAGKVLYSNDFQKAATGKPADEFLIVGGDFVVVDAGDGNKCLELPGAPLDYFGLLFGPADKSEVAVSAKVWAENTGKRFPEFGIGAGDVGGPRLWLIPAQRKLELRKGDDTLASADCSWTPGKWVTLQLSITKSAAGGSTMIGTVQPQAASAAPITIRFEDKEPPAAGHASIWGAPFSDKPIRFDDLTVSATTEK